MRWTQVYTSPELETFELWEENSKLLSLDYHPFTNAARIEHAAERRVFMIRREGFLRNRVVLRNEYGIHIGQLLHDKHNRRSGNIELGNEKFNFVLSDAENGQLRMSRSKSDESLVCDFSQGIPAGNTGTLTATQQCLLMAFSWYLCLHTHIPAQEAVS
jgi:hypothetical protein